MRTRVRFRTSLFPVIVAVLSALATAAIARPTERVSPAPQCNPNAVVWRTPKPPANPQAGDIWVNPKDGAKMVYVPAGEFLLGTSEAEASAWLKEHPSEKRAAFREQQPQCRVSLPSYWIGRTEVTGAQYQKFIKATNRLAPDYWPDGQCPDRWSRDPVGMVDWKDAAAYCEWAAGRLPTELEWEKAARGADGRAFPWGNKWDRRCVSIGEGPHEVGTYPLGASPYGCLDMAGNLQEWCADWYTYGPDPYSRYARGDLTPPKPGTVRYRVVRGGDWDPARAGGPTAHRCAYRHLARPLTRDAHLGFRCVFSAK